MPPAPPAPPAPVIVPLFTIETVSVDRNEELTVKALDDVLDELITTPELIVYVRSDTPAIYAPLLFVYAS
jgi:hypothetical protein